MQSIASLFMLIEDCIAIVNHKTQKRELALCADSLFWVLI